jgi:hypothetical protein
MSIVYQCAGCQKRFKVADTSVGKRVKCKECGAVGTVTAPRGAGAAAAAAPPPPPPPPPPRRPAEEEDPFAAMAELERSGTVNEDEGAYATVPPPPPPASSGAGTQYAPPPPPRASSTNVAPVAAPWVPSYLSFLDFQKPFHRIVLMAAFAVFAAGGLVLAGWAYKEAQEDSHFNSVAKQAKGMLVGKAVRHDIHKRRRRDIEAYDVKYAFEVGGKRYNGEHDQVEVEDLPGDPDRSFDGQNAAVTVFYDPDNPGVNRLEKANTPGDWILFGIGAVIVPVGLFGGWRVWRYDRYARSIGT